MGRPVRLTEQLIEGFRAVLLAGNYRTVAARLFGVSPRTFRRWMANGRRFPDGIYARFRSAVVKAEAEFEVNAVATINAAGRDDPWLLMSMLERKFPQRWGKYRGELGELKRRIRDLERMLEDLDRRPDEKPDPGSR